MTAHAAHGSPSLTARHRAETVDGYLGVARRLRWPAERLATHRESALRSVLANAVHHSPFHAERLAGIDPGAFTEEQLPSLPIMTKADLMDNFDTAVTDPRLTSSSVQRHLDDVGDGEPYLFGEYRVLSSSGSSGVRGNHIYSWEEWKAFSLMTARTRLSLPDGSSRPSGRAVACLFGAGDSVMSSAVLGFLGDVDEPFVHLPVVRPLPELVDALNALQPVVLQGYPSAIDMLTTEARAGRLRISPRYVETGGESLGEGTRSEVRELWGVAIDDCWALTEGITAVTCQGSRAMHLPDDLVIVEPVDERGSVVPAGTPAQSFLLTSLYRFAQPLIRYRIEDALTVLDTPCACGSTHRRITDVVGRRDIAFNFDRDVVVYPYYLGMILDRDRRIREFQVVQTKNGVILRLVTDPGTPTSALQVAVSELLAGFGVVRPVVSVDLVERIQRLPSGKLPRYVKLDATAVTPAPRSDPR